MPASVAATRIDSGIRSEPAGQQVSGDRTHVGVAGHEAQLHAVARAEGGAAQLIAAVQHRDRDHRLHAKFAFQLARTA